MKSKTLIVGAGPAGLMCAIEASSEDNQVIVIDKNEKVGRKLYISGKGRCNVTNYCDVNEMISNVVTNARFLYSSLNKFSAYDTKEFFESNGVPLVVERGNRVFPKSYKASDIIDCLFFKAKRNGVIFNLKEEVKEIKKDNDKFVVITDKQEYIVDNLVIATGGISYPTTGSTGEGYEFAKSLGHSITDLFPGLCAMKIKERIPRSLNAFTLKNVSLNVKGNKFTHSAFGELSFYDGYIDGPIVLSTSSLINKLKEEISIEIDLKPALNEETLLERINRDIEKTPNITTYELLKGLLPIELISFFLENSKIKQNKIGDKNYLVNSLKHFKLTYDGLLGFDRAIITSGGINIKEINPSTMESKLVNNLYFAGEIIDVDAYTGGFNIQIALSTGYCAGKAIKQNG